MSNDRELRVKIKTEADVAGAKQAGDAMAGAAKHVKLFSGEALELRKAIGELSRQFPLAGEALRLLTNPAGGAIVLGIAAFTKAKEALDEWNKSLDETIQKNSEATFADGLNAKKKALEDAQMAFEVYLQKLHAGIDAEQEFSEGVERSAAVMKASADVQKSLGDASFGLDEAKLKASLDAGLIDQTEYFNQLAALEIKHDQDNRRRHQQEQDDDLKFKEATLAGRQTRQEQLDSAAKTALRGATGLKGDAARDEADLATLKGRQKELDDTAKESQAAAGIAGFWNTLAHGFTFGAVGLHADPAKVAAARAASDASAQNFGASQRLAKRLPGEQTAAALSQADADRAEAAAERNEAATEKLTDEVKTLTLTIAATRPGEHAAGSITDLTKLLSKSQEATGIFAVAGIQGKLDRGQSLTPDEVLAVNHFDQMAAQNGANMDKLIDGLRKLLAHAGNSAAQIDDIWREINLMKSRYNNNSSGGALNPG